MSHSYLPCVSNLFVEGSKVKMFTRTDIHLIIFQAVVTADNKSKVTCAHVETDEVFSVNLAPRELICHSEEHEHGDPS